MSFSWDCIVLGLPLSRWVVGSGLFVLGWTALYILKNILSRKLLILAKTTTSDIDDFLVGLLDKTTTWFLAVGAFTLTATYFGFAPNTHKIIHSIFVVGLLLQAALWGEDSIRFFLQRILEKKKARSGNDPALETTMAAFQCICRLALYAIVILLILDNLGFNITTLVAGLGVGGIAVALAAQNILGDLFASMSIVMDKPFVIGDSIDLGTHKGVVEKIGLKTTRIRSVTGEQIIISNTDLLHSRILNFQRMNERRVAFSLGVVYQTESSKIKRIPELLEEIIGRQKNARFDRAHFKAFGSSSLDFEVVYFVKSGDFLDYVGIEHRVNMEILEIFGREGIEFAYPTRTILMEKSA